MRWKAKPWCAASTVSVLQAMNWGPVRKIDPVGGVLGELKAEIHEDNFFVHVCLDIDAVAALAHLRSRPAEPDLEEGTKASKKKGGWKMECMQNRK